MLPGFCLDAVVAIEQVEPAKDTDQRFRAVGSGVLVGRLVDEEAVGDDRFSIYLVTNRHVIEGQSSLHAKFNVGARAPANRFELRVRDPEGNDLWFGSEEFDVAVTHLSTPELRRAEVRIAPVPEEKWLDLDALRELDAGPGDEVFVVGFPLGIAGNERKHSIVRSGIIARLDPEIVHETGAFLVDCSVFPGNSGGPVFRKQMFFVDYDEEPPKLSWYPPDFIGIVKSYLPFIDTAVSLQTNRPRVSFEENSGLAYVVPVDAIRAAIQEHEAAVASPAPALAEPTLEADSADSHADEEAGPAPRTASLTLVDAPTDGA